MLNILVVDDEPRNRKGIVNLIKEFRPSYVVNEAKNGEEALKFIEFNNVEILITDIKMPIMDGLELTERIIQTKKNIKVIILSAYAYFEYAQKAISLGAVDYLIKPVDQTKVIETIVRVENKIKIEKNVLDEKEKLVKQIEDTLPAYMEARLKRWINGYLKKNEEYDIEKVFPYEGNGYVILCEIMEYKELSINYSVDENDEIKLNIKYWMNELLNTLGNSISFFQQVENENAILVSIVKTNEEINLNDKKNIEIFYELIESIKTGYKLNLVIGISNLCNNIRSNAKIAYKQASMAISYKFYYENSRVLEYLRIEQSHKRQQLNKVKEEDSLMEAFIEIDEEKTINIMNKIIDNIIIKDIPQPQYFIDKVINVILKLAEAVQGKLSDEDYYELILNIKEELLYCLRLINVKEKCEELLINLIRLHESSKSNDRIMKKCVEYIDKNYTKEISLEQLAGKFYFNTSYFSSYFKNHTGINFSQYLLKLRMEKSKELLENTNLKIYEIAAQVGYLDAKYFNRLFKNEFSISPQKYRRVILGGRK